MAGIEPDPQQLASFSAAAGTRGPISMLNLLRYRAQADYAGRANVTACSGREAYQRYAALAVPCVEAVGGRVVFAATAFATVIGPAAEQWDDILLVEYPSVDALLGMLASEPYRRCCFHRSAALADARLVASHQLTLED